MEMETIQEDEALPRQREQNKKKIFPNSVEKLAEICFLNNLSLPMYSLIHEVEQSDGAVRYTIRCEVVTQSSSGEKNKYETHCMKKNDKNLAKALAASKMLSMLRLSMPKLRTRLSPGFEFKYEIDKEEVAEVEKRLQASAIVRDTGIRLTKMHFALGEPECSITHILSQFKMAEPDIAVSFRNKSLSDIRSMIDKLKCAPDIDIQIHISQLPSKASYLGASRYLTFCRLISKISLSFCALAANRDTSERQACILLFDYLFNLVIPNTTGVSRLLDDSDDE